MPAKGKKHDESIKKQIVITLLFGTDRRARPIHLRFDSILEAEKQLGINRGYIYRLANKHSTVIGAMSVTGNIRIEETQKPLQKGIFTEAEDEIKDDLIKEHLKKVAWYCERHKVHIAAGRDCPLCGEESRKQLQ